MATMALGRTWSLRWEFDFPKNRTPSRTLAAEGSLHRQSNWSKRPENASAKTSVEIGAPFGRALPLKINFYPIGQPSCKFRRDRMGGARFCLSA
jgi:hypothetical protein